MAVQEEENGLQTKVKARQTRQWGGSLKVEKIKLGLPK